MAEDDSNSVCSEKLSFDTKGQAEGSAVTADWQHGAKLKPYLCKDCGYWHLTSN